MSESDNIGRNSNKQMTSWGIGPKMLLYLSPFIILVLIIHFAFYPVFLIPIEYIIMIILGSLLILIGFILYLKSVILINKAFNASELVTTGVYGHMRHPLYAAFILFISPGIACFFNSWLGFIIPCVYYIIFRILIKREEDYCLDKFGERYIHYKEKVFRILPKLRKYKLISK